uniref:hypothetical protein n=1 Tax=Nocardia pseudovaccinii TaxID=189540 RepID=UPI0007A3C5F9
MRYVRLSAMFIEDEVTDACQRSVTTILAELAGEDGTAAQRERELHPAMQVEIGDIEAFLNTRPKSRQRRHRAAPILPLRAQPTPGSTGSPAGPGRSTVATIGLNRKDAKGFRGRTRTIVETAPLSKRREVRPWGTANQIELVFLPACPSWLNGTDHRGHDEQDAVIGEYVRQRSQHPGPVCDFAVGSKIRRPDYLPNVA